MKRILFLLTGLLSAVVALAAESPVASAPPAAKKLWATSFLGKPAPEFVVEKWLTAEPERKGKFVLIDFWATWCPPCRKAIPELNALKQTLGDRLVVIGVSDETEEKVRALKDPRLDYASAIDTQGRMKKALGVKGIPHVIIVDPAGIVRWEGFPLLEGYELTERAVRDALEQGTARQRACGLAREQLAGAKKLWAAEHKQQAAAMPTENDLAGYLSDGQLPACPDGGKFTLNPVDQAAACSLHGVGKP